MPSDVSGPDGRTPHPDGLTPDPFAHDPGPPPSTSSSGDDLTLGLNAPRPDPFLGEFVQGGPPASPMTSATAGEEGSGPGSVDSGLPGPSASTAAPGTSEALASLRLESAPSPPTAPTATPEPDAASGSFPALDVFASAPPRPRVSDAAADQGEEEDEEDDELPPRGMSWLMLLLASYASALTIFLLWHYYREHRAPREAVEPDLPVVTDRPDPGRRASESARIEPPAPLAPDHLTTLGNPIRVGSLEVTPLGVASGPVVLTRSLVRRERREGGKGALKLRLRLRNTSQDAAFYPLDEAFLREDESGGRDSLIEPGREPAIGMYPLAVSSEWSIAGQEFRKLRPGEAYETTVVSAPDAAAKAVGELTWRLRVRTGIEQTDTVGVRFRDSDIRPGR